MIKVKLKVGRNVHRLDVWSAKYNADDTVSFYTSLNERNVFKVARGNTVTFESVDPEEDNEDIKILTDRFGSDAGILQYKPFGSAVY